MNPDVDHTVILLNMGGPDSQDSVKGFLLNLFHDPDILRLPGGRFTRSLLARWIVRNRLERVKASYQQLGGGSPIGTIMAAQCHALEKILGPRVQVLRAMRYWHPFAKETLAEIPPHHKVILLSLYPHRCEATTGSSFGEMNRLIENLSDKFRDVVEITGYPTHPGFLSSWRSRIQAALAASPFDPARTHVVFSAHGVPMSVVRRGDPYQKEIMASVRELASCLPEGVKHTLAYQSRVGPIRWLEPDVKSVIAQLGREEVGTILVVPISFTVDNLETLFELNIELRELAEASGIRDFRVAEALNTLPEFMECLATQVRPHLTH